ncbi:MAG: nucleotidyltransferase domain-containing protein [Deltaproteobacteria bacterium]|nr:nucleotidyltransferase domain-containing protein [Deltaproteobacteria bacterium]
MDKKAVIEIVDRFRLGLEARGIRPQKIILYGSHATGFATAESDIDLVVISSDFSDKGYWERVDVLSDVIYEMFVPLDAVAMTPDELEREDSFVVEFARTGQVVYAA